MNKWEKEVSKRGITIKRKGNHHRTKLEFFCPHCNKITGTIDDKYLLEYGFCAECYVMHVEDREVPTIDLEKYKPVKS